MPHESLRDILPLLRPRSAEPTLFTQTVFYALWLGLATLAALYFYRRRRLRQRREWEFRALARELGLEEEGIDLVRRVARERRVEQPQRLLTSARVFDRNVGAYASRLAQRDRHHPVLTQIAGIRRALGFEDLPTSQSLTSTRQIDRGQTVMVWQGWDDGEGYPPWLVIERDEGAMAVVPLLRRDDAHASGLSAGDEISIRFWREGDTEYRFSTHVIDHDPEAGAFVLEHATRMERLQQRDFFRIDVDFDITLFSMPETGSLGPAPEDQVESAAVALLDREDADEDEEFGLADAEVIDAQSDEGGTAEVPAIDVSQSEKLEGRVTNLSASGMALEVAPTDVLRPTRWVVDPEFTGGYPLAALVCEVVDEEPESQMSTLKLRFEDLPPQAEREIVRQVYQHQLLGAGGRDAALRQRVDLGEVDPPPPDSQTPPDEALPGPGLPDQ